MHQRIEEIVHTSYLTFDS